MLYKVVFFRFCFYFGLFICNSYKIVQLSQELGNSGKGMNGIMNPEIKLEKIGRQKRTYIWAGIGIMQVMSGKDKCINNERGRGRKPWENQRGEHET